jgi:putative ABC transport system permease protein
MYSSTETVRSSSAILLVVAAMVPPLSFNYQLDTLLRDIRIGLRLLRRTPLLAATALLSIALSVGGTAVVFTAVKSVLLNPLPYAHAERLVQLRTEYKLAGPSHADWIFWNDIQEIIRRTRTRQSVGIYRNAVFDLGGSAATPPEALYGLDVSASLFPTLGVSPMLGRNIQLLAPATLL